MYNPTHFQEQRAEVLHALIRQQPLATLVTLGADGLVANQIPLYLRADAGPLGSLVGHVARANPLWQDCADQVDALAVFQGAQAYISPRWYASKAVHGKVVPTWNYITVQARGPLQVHQDAAWIRAQLQELTGQQEAPADTPWTVDDAPRDYTDRLLAALVGIEIPIRQLSGKYKLSQNQPADNQASVLQALRTAGSAADLRMADAMAAVLPPVR